MNNFLGSKIRVLSINPDKVEFSREPSFESDPLENFELYCLTRREIEVLAWVAEGKTNNEIGIILNISSRTVSKHLQHIYIKVGVESRTAAVVQFLEILQQARKLKKPVDWAPQNPNQGIKEMKMFLTNIRKLSLPVT